MRLRPTDPISSGRLDCPSLGRGATYPPSPLASRPDRVGNGAGGRRAAGSVTFLASRGGRSRLWERLVRGGGDQRQVGRRIVPVDGYQLR